MKEYSRKPYMSKSYNDMMKTTTTRAVLNQKLFKLSEFEKPYASDSYSDMQHVYHQSPTPGFDRYDMPKEGMPADVCADLRKRLAEAIKISPYNGELSIRNPNVVALSNEYTRANCPSGPITWYGCTGTVYIDYPTGKTCIGIGETAKAEFDQNYTDPIVKIEGEFPLAVTYSLQEPQQRETVNGTLFVWVTLSETTTDTSLTLTATTQSGLTCWLSINVCPCECTGISIGYTTQGMAINEEQTLTVTGAVTGCTYNWATDYGTFDSATGTSVVFTAPSSNAECASNPTITLSVEGTVCDTLKIAVNVDTTDDVAYWTVGVYSEESCTWTARVWWYTCRGSYKGTTFACDGCSCQVEDCDCGGGFHCTEAELIARCGDVDNRCLGDCTPRDIDRRTAGMITGGCCPGALL